MTDNNQPFSPPLTAEERDAWDLVYMGCCVQNTVESSAKHADEAIHERRRRFGVPGPTAQDLCAQELFRKVCDKSEIDTLRAEVARLTKERDAMMDQRDSVSATVNELVTRAEKAEANATSLRQSLHASEALRDALKTEIKRLTKDVQVRENVYRIRCEQVDALVARAEKAEKERDEARDYYRDVVTKLEQCSDSLGPINRELASMRARAEKAEAELAKVTAREKEGVELMDKIIADLRAELAAARPVLEEVVRWFSERAWTVKDSDTLRDYAMSQRAARAGKSPDATNDTNGGM